MTLVNSISSGKQCLILQSGGRTDLASLLLPPVMASGTIRMTLADEMWPSELVLELPEAWPVELLSKLLEASLVALVPVRLLLIPSILVNIEDILNLGNTHIAGTILLSLFRVSTFGKEGIDAADSPSVGLNLVHQITNIVDLKAVVTDQACNLIDAKFNRRRMRIVWWTAGNSVATLIHSIDDLVRLVCIEIVMKERPHGFIWPKGTNNCVA